MTIAARHLVPVFPAVPSLLLMIGSFVVTLVVLVVGGIWGFRLGDGGGRGGGGSKRPPRREPPPPPGGLELPDDFAAWEAELRAADATAAAGDRKDAAHREDKSTPRGLTRR
jgi:hypothetical protein